MPEDDIWKTLDENLAGLSKSGTMEVLVETPIPTDLDKMLDANIKAIQDAELPRWSSPIGANADIRKLSNLPALNQRPTTTLSPLGRAAESVPTLTPEMGEQFINAQETRRQAEQYPLLSPALRPIEAGLGSLSEWGAETSANLQQASEQIGRLTGLKPGDLFSKISKTFQGSAALYNTMAKGTPEQPPLPYVIDFTAKAAGRAYGDIGAMSLLGPAGMTLWTAFNEWAAAPDDKKLEGFVTGMAKGALLQGTFHAINQLPSVAQIPTLFGTGMGLEVAQGATPAKAAESGLVWSGLGLLGGKNLVTKEEFLSRYSEVAALNKIKATRFLKQWKVDDQGRIFQGSAPSLIRRDMSGVADYYTDDMIDAAGGPVEAAKTVARAMQEQYAKMNANMKAIVEARNKKATEGEVDAAGLPEAIHDIPPEHGRNRLPELGAWQKAQERARAKEKAQMEAAPLPEAIPKQGYAPEELPASGVFVAMETTDGRFFLDRKDSTHIKIVQSQGIPLDQIKSSGIVVDGKYQPIDISTQNMLKYIAAKKGEADGVPGAAEEARAFERAGDDMVQFPTQNGLRDVYGPNYFPGDKAALFRARREEEARAAAAKNLLTNEPTPDILRGQNEQPTDNAVHPGVAPGNDQVLHGRDGNEPGRSDALGEPGVVRGAQRPLRPGLREATPGEYVAAFDSALANNPFRLQATRPTPEGLTDHIAKGGRIIMSDDAQAGVVVTPDGEPSHVFQGPGGSIDSRADKLHAAIEEGLASGGRRLNAFNTSLVNLYGRAGYRPVSRIAFNPEYAPEGWDYAAYSRWNEGKPDVVFMVHDGVVRSPAEIKGMIREIGYANDYDIAADMAKNGAGSPVEGQTPPEVAPGKGVAQSPLRTLLESLNAQAAKPGIDPASKADLMDTIRQVEEAAQVEEQAGAATAPVTPTRDDSFRQLPTGTGEEAKGLTEVEKKMAAAMRGQAPAPGKPANEGKRGQVTMATNLIDADLISMNERQIGAVPKGQGAEVIKKLQAQFPDARLSIGANEAKVMEPDSIETITERAKAQAATKASKKSLLVEGDAPLADSELFGDAAHEAAIAAAQKAEAAAKATAVTPEKPAKKAKAAKKARSAEEIESMAEMTPEERAAYKKDSASYQKPTDDEVTKWYEEGAKESDAEAAAPTTPGPVLYDKETREPFQIKERRGDWVDVVSQDGKTRRSVRSDMIDRFFRIGAPQGIVAPGVSELSDAVEKFKTNFLDKYYPVHSLVDAMKKAGISIDTISDPSIMVRLLAGIPGMAETKLRYKRFSRDASGNIVFGGESLHDIIKPFIHGKNYGRFNDYLVYRRAIEIDRRSRGKIKTGVDLARARQFVQQNTATYDAAAKKFTDYFHSLLDELQGSGLMDKDVVSDLKRKNPEYAPFKRVLEEMDKRGIPSTTKEALDKVGSTIKKLRGSELEVIPPTESAVLMTYEITSAVERNRAAQAIINLRDLSPDLATKIVRVKPKIRMVRDLNTGKDVPTIADKQDPDVVAVSFDGKRQYYRVPEDIAGAMKQIHGAGLADWVKFMAKPARLLRTGATLSPEFMLRNPARDIQTAYTNSKSGFNPLVDFPRGLIELISRPEEYWKWKASGGEWSMLATMDRAFGAETIKQMHKESAGGVAKYIKSPLGYLEALSEYGEKPTRLGVFHSGKRSGMSDMEAAIESREASTDFHVRGANDAVRTWGALSTFFNARLQTTVKMMRTAKEDPVGFTLRGTASAALPAIILYAFNRNDPDYWKRDELERATFWFLPIDYKGRQVKIPKGEIGVLFGTLVEKVLQYFDEKAEYRPKIDEFLKNALQSASPIGNWGELLPVAMRPVIENLVNRSAYYNTKLYDDDYKKQAAFLQYKPQTSETMKLIGQQMAGAPGLKKRGGVEPVALENLVTGYTGGLGRLGLKASDWALDKLGAVDVGEKAHDPGNIPGVRGFMSRKATGFESEPAQKFYQMAEDIERYKTTIKELGKQGRGQEIEQWIKTHPLENAVLSLNLDTQWSSKREELSTLRKAMNLIVENKTLSGAQKAEALEILNKQVSTIVDPLWHLINLLDKEKGALLKSK